MKSLIRNLFKILDEKHFNKLIIYLFILVFYALTETIGLALINLLSVSSRFPGVMPLDFIAVIRSVDEIPSVYFGSTNSPFHFDRKLITF